MPLTDEQRSKIMNWFNSKIGKIKCPICNTDYPKALPLEKFQSVALSYDDNKVIGNGMPSVITICPHCGYIMQFSSLKIGV